MSLEDDDWEPAPGEHPTWSMDEIESHPLFMTEVPAEATNAHIEALQSVLFDEETPDSLSQSFKEQGNEALKRGLLNDAGICYERALDTGCKDRELLSQIHGNLALVRLKQERYPECVDECYRAIGGNPSSVKAFYRGAMASLKMDLYSQGIYFAKGGLDVDPENADLKSVLQELEAKRDAQIEAKKQLETVSEKPRPKYRWRD